MTLTSVISSSIILSILMTASFHLNSLVLDSIKQEKTKIVFTDLQESVTTYYDENNALPANLSVLDAYVEGIGNLNELVDSYGNNFEFLKATSISDLDLIQDTESSVSGIAYIFLETGRNNVLDSNITSQEFNLINDEKFTFLTKKRILQGKRGVTIEKIKKCNSAYTLYLTNFPASTPSTSDLVGKGYVNGRDVVDEWGSLMYTNNADGKCYSPSGLAGDFTDV